ncbi:type I phosphomannose isomerase catalytic subunit [Paenibacillus koleovorans]|uniref:type I phosphomannose isomerase catalytic subunit n=1 Tax=Paenibacillus koleovorans TaxID=121608 RepID=UPI000FD9E48C|nr:type I phosphomannose isomerase catalytic subunit [Paenibacillus koleovorans]
MTNSTTVKPYPLLFQPLLKERVWGGRSLEQFGLELPEGPIGEGWMIGDHPNGTTRVVNGAFAGAGLDDVRKQYGASFFGTKGEEFTGDNGRFPLLIKLLDCNDDLSVQVHPDNGYSKLPPGELGKTEMWYVLGAKPGSKIIYGLQPGKSRDDVARALQDGTIMDVLQLVDVQAGDSFYIPAGTVHALCAGVLVAEIQQNSDTTYRLFDYNRPGLDGKPRELHIEDSLNVIAYEGSGATRMTTELAAPQQWLTLAESPYFRVEKAKVEGEWKLSTTPDSFVILVVCDGGGEVTWPDGRIGVKPGDCLLLPASLGDYALEGAFTVLRSYLP